MSEKNEYETDEEERDAYAASFAGRAEAMLIRYFVDMPDDDPWADKVADVLCEAMEALKDLAHEEVKRRPGMLELGRAHHAKWREDNAEAFAAVDAEIARIVALEEAP